MIRFNWLTCVGVLFCLTLIACGGSSSGSGSNGNTPPTLQSIQVTPATKSLYSGQTQQYTATGTYSDGTTRTLTSTANWLTSDATLATITSGGLATAQNKAGIATITASSAGVSGTAQLTVVALQSIQVTPANPSVITGAHQQFTATGTYSDSSTQNLTSSATWASSNTGVATISSSGQATAVAVGNATISATLGSVVGSTVLTVNAPPLVSIAVTPPTASIAPNATQPFAATGTYADHSSRDITNQVTWSAPSGVTITAAGLATGITPGVYTITASLSGVTATASLTVTNPIVSIAVTPPNPSAHIDTNVQFTATATYYDHTTGDITSTASWTSSDTTIATISDQLPTKGLAHTIAAGPTTIQASSQGVHGSTLLTVTPAQLMSIAVTPANISLSLGLQQQYTATGTYSDNTQQDITNSVTWASSDVTKATITASGLATGVAPGATTISATKDQIPGSTGLTVNAANLLSIVITPANLSMAPGTSRQLAATGHFDNGSIRDVTSLVAWASSNTAQATVASNGFLRAIQTGTPNITATLNSVTGTLALNVTSATISSVAVTPVTLQIAVGTHGGFTATGYFNDGSSQTITNDCTWASDNQAIATVNLGSVTGVAAGTAHISATFGSQSGSGTLTVTAAPLTSVTVSPAQVLLAPSTTQQFSAQGFFSDGSHQSVPATWTSDTPSVVSITQNGGLATGQSAGTAIITGTATVNGVTHSGTASVIVTPAQLAGIVIAPSSTSLPTGISTSFTATGMFSDGSQQNLTAFVTWASSDPTVATIGNTSGRQGLANAVSAGTTTITAVYSGVVGTATLTVTSAALSSIVVTPANSSVSVGGTVSFTATGHFSDSTQLNLTSQVTWSSSTSSVVISTSGVATGVSVGQSTISASLNGVTGQTTLTVH